MATSEPPPSRPERVPEPLRITAAWSWRLILVAIAVAGIVYAIVHLLLVVLPVIFALLLATVLAPLVELLARRGWPRPLATTAVLLGALIVLGGIFAALILQSIDALGDLNFSLSAGIERVRDFLNDTFGLSEGRVDDLLEQARDYLTTSGLGQTVVGGTLVAFEVIVGLLLAIALLFFFLKDGARMWGWLSGALGESRRRHIDEIGRRAFVVLGGYVRGSAIVGAFDATLLAVVLLLLGVPLVVSLAVLTFFAAFFPIIGGTVAGVVAALVALATEGIVDALIVTAAIIVIQQVEGNVLQPLVMGRVLRLHPVVIILALTAGATLAGIIGAFLAVPVAAVGVAAGKYLRGLSGEPDVPPPPHDRPAGGVAAAQRE